MPELTKNTSGWKYFKLLEEYDKIKRGEVELEGTSTAPFSDDNLFFWTATIFGPEGYAQRIIGERECVCVPDTMRSSSTMWEGGFYNVEITFSDEDDAPPRIRFTTKMFHPHINPDGVPYYIPPLTRVATPVTTILKWLWKLLKDDIISSPNTFLNREAARLCFSTDENDRKDFKKRVARCVRQSVEC